MEIGKENLNRQIQLIFEISSLSPLSAPGSVSRAAIYSSAQEWVVSTLCRSSEYEQASASC